MIDVDVDLDVSFLLRSNLQRKATLRYLSLVIFGDSLALVLQLNTTTSV